MSLRNRPSASLAAAIALLLLGTPAVSYAGAFFFAGFGSGLNSISHPNGYTGSGASITVTVCIDPASANKAAMTTSVENVVNTFNGLQPTIGNLVFGDDNNVPNAFVFDFESVLLHEVGHCLGLAHPNLGTESGLSEPDRNNTKSTDGTNNGDEFCNPPGDPGGAYPCDFDIDDGTDNIIGSADDVRGGDDNLHWFRESNNHPFTIAGTVDSTTYSRNLADLPGGHLYAANADRTVGAALGFADTEAVMQQGQSADEAQRTLNHDDVATLRYGMAGVDELSGTGDDYTFSLGFVGESDSCDVVISMENIAGFAFCSSGGFFIGASDHVQMAQNVVKIDSADFTWFFNDVSNGACSIATDLVLNNQSVGGTVVEEACETITATNYTVQSPGDATFRAGSKIILGDGFNVQSGGSFVAEIDPGIN